MSEETRRMQATIVSLTAELEDAERERERLTEEFRVNDEDYAAVSLENTTLREMLNAVIKDYDEDHHVYGDTILRARATLDSTQQALQEPAPQSAEAGE